MKIKKLLYYYVSFVGNWLSKNLKTLKSWHSPTLENMSSVTFSYVTSQPLLRYIQ